MSELNSFGNTSISQPQSVSPSNAFSPIQEQNILQNYFEVLEQLLRSQKQSDQKQGLEILLGLISKGHNILSYSPIIVQFVASTDPQIKQLAFVLLSHLTFAGDQSIFLSVNTFQRNLTDYDLILRALSVKLLSSVGTSEQCDHIQNAVEAVQGDPSPYVKKAASIAMIKACTLNPSFSLQFYEILKRFMNETSPITLSGAFAAYCCIFPTKVELIHPNFRRYCHKILDFDSFGQLFFLKMMKNYTRLCFSIPDIDNREFWEEGHSAQISDDYILLLSSVRKILFSPNVSIVLEAASFLFHNGISSELSCIAKPLIRLIYDAPFVAEPALKIILQIVSKYQEVFLSHIQHFVVFSRDSPKIKDLKLQVLAQLSTPETVHFILNELSIYSLQSDQNFASAAVKTYSKIASLNPDVIPFCFVSLLNLLSFSTKNVLNETVISLTYLLRMKRGTDDESHALHQLCRKFLEIVEPAARASVLSIVGEMYESHQEFAPQLLQFVAKNYASEPPEVKLQALIISAKLIILKNESKIPLYLLKLGERDSSFDVRNLSRFFIGLTIDKPKEIDQSILQMFTQRKEVGVLSDLTDNDFVVGTLSHFFNRKIKGYEPLPDWAEDVPDASVRDSSFILPEEKKKQDEFIPGLDDFFGKESESNSYSYYSDEEEKPEEKNKPEENVDIDYNDFLDS